ncbi:MAG: hypothetical protein WC879_05035 [Melioribacteraceae bacterium]
MKKLFLILIVLADVALSTSIPTQAKKNNYKNDDSVIAKVGSIKITVNEFVYGYEYGPAFYKRSKNSKFFFLENLIREKLLAFDGYSRGLDTTNNVKEYFNAIRDDLATEELFKDEIQSKITFTQEEIDTVAKQKIIDVEIQWLYSRNEKEIVEIQDSLNRGVDFQQLFDNQLNDTISLDDRSLKSSRFQVEMKNPELGKVIDKLETGKYSIPIKTNDGWYIVRLRNFSYNLIPSETEQNKVLDEARRAVIKMKMDLLSDKYVNEFMLAQNPVIKRKPFQILRSYLADNELSKEKYSEWKLDEILNNVLKEYEPFYQNYYSKIVLVELKDYNITLNDFLIWYRTRNQYVKFDKRSFAKYSRSLEQIVWRMIRDKILCNVAETKGFYKNKIVNDQSKWWLDKILYAEIKNEMINMIILEKKEINTKENDKVSQSEYIEDELTKKLFYKLNELKNKYPVVINEKLLNEIKVSDEDNIKAIDLFTVKRGGLLPRTPYPTIDNYWARWQ